MDGIIKSSFKRDESVIIRPKRTISQTCYVDFQISAAFFSRLCQSLVNLKFSELTVDCKGDN